MRYVAVMTRQHPGIDSSRRDGVMWGPVILDTASLAEAFDRARIVATENIGSYGNVGCGSTRVAVSDDLAEKPDEDDVDDFYSINDPSEAGDVPKGTYTIATLRELRSEGRHVWNDRNHVDIDPEHYEEGLRLSRMKRQTG